MTINDFKFYPVKIIKNPDSTYTIQTRNWEGAISEAETLEDAQRMAGVLVTDVISSLFDDNEPIPQGAEVRNGDYVVELTLDQALKIALKNIMTEERYRKADLARGLGIAPQRMTTFLSLRKSTSLAFLEQAFAFVKRPLNVIA